MELYSSKVNALTMVFNQGKNKERSLWRVSCSWHFTLFGWETPIFLMPNVRRLGPLVLLWSWICQYNLFIAAYPFDAFRFTYFSRASLDYIAKSGKQPDVLHIHNWETAIVGPLFWDIFVNQVQFETAFLFFSHSEFIWFGTQLQNICCITHFNIIFLIGSI